MKIENVVEAIRADRVRISDHADEEARQDGLSIEEILSSVGNGEIIEEYEDDKPYPSCLLHGTTSAGDPVHTVWGYNQDNGWVVLVTVYRPDPTRWIQWRTRRPKK